MTQQFKVAFLKPNSDFLIQGTVIDKYSGILDVRQTFPSGNCGMIQVSDFKINTDFYLIIGNDDETYKIPCCEVIIVV